MRPCGHHSWAYNTSKGLWKEKKQILGDLHFDVTSYHNTIKSIFKYFYDKKSWQDKSGSDPLETRVPPPSSLHIYNEPQASFGESRSWLPRQHKEATAPENFPCGQQGCGQCSWLFTLYKRASDSPRRCINYGHAEIWKSKEDGSETHCPLSWLGCESTGIQMPSWVIKEPLQ